MEQNLIDLHQEEPFASINITPLVDVILVLLVLFLMTAPAFYPSALKIQLPEAKTGEKTEKNLFSFSLSKDGNIYWNEQLFSQKDLSKQLASLKHKRLKETAIIHADEAAPHGKVIQLIDTLRQNGVTQFALSVQETNSGTRGEKRN